MCVDTNGDYECESVPTVHGMIDGNAYHSSLTTWPAPLEYVRVRNLANTAEMVNRIVAKNELPSDDDGEDFRAFSTDKMGDVLVKLNSGMYNKIKSLGKPENIGANANSKDIPSLVVVPTMDMGFAHFGGYKGEYVCEINQELGKYFYKKHEQNIQSLTAQDDIGGILPWKQQILNTEKAAACNPLRLFPLFSYDPRRYSHLNEKSSKEDGYCEKWDSPFTRIVGYNAPDKDGKNLWLGFCMNPGLGFRPFDEFCEYLPRFYKKCVKENIPILAHCVPGGLITHDAKYYPDDLAERIRKSKERHQMMQKKKLSSVSPQDALCSSMYCGEECDVDINADMDYFYMNNGHPRNWIPVLKYFPKLSLCLSGFGGNSEWQLAEWSDNRGMPLLWPTREWIRCIIKLTAAHENVYVDISGLNIYDANVSDGLWKMLTFIDKAEFKHLKRKLIFGSGWYLTHLTDASRGDGQDIKHSYSNYCREFKTLFNDIDGTGELWDRVSLVNPWNFYKLSEDKFKNMLSAIQNNKNGKKGVVSGLSQELKRCCKYVIDKNKSDEQWKVSSALPDSECDLADDADDDIRNEASNPFKKLVSEINMFKRSVDNGVAFSISAEGPFRPIDNCLRDELIQYLRGRMERYNAKRKDSSKAKFNDVVWLDSVQETLRCRTESRKDTLKLMLIDRNIGTEIAYFDPYEHGNSLNTDSEFHIFFNVNKVIEKKMSYVQLYAIFIHELRHFWQRKTDVWGNSLKLPTQRQLSFDGPGANNGSGTSYHNVCIEVDAYDIQFELEQNLRVKTYSKDAKEQFRTIEKRNRNSLEKWERLKARYLSDNGGYNTAKGYIDPFRCHDAIR